MTMYAKEFECPSCGAPIQRNNPSSKTLGCPFCGQVSHINADSVEAAGAKHLLVDYGSIIHIGQSGKIDGRDFMVLGRVRLNYEDGFWDEWYINFLDDGTAGWIQEDDGSFTLFQKQKTLGEVHYDNINVGYNNDIDGQWEPFFVTSKSHAHVNGGEGELPFRIIPGEKADFIDGIWNGQPLSIELLADENILFVGKAFELEALILS